MRQISRLQNCIFIRTLWFFCVNDLTNQVRFWLHTFLARIWDPKNWMSISSAPYYLFLWHSRKLATNSQNDDWCQLAPKENLRGFDENWMSESIISRSFILGLTNQIFFHQLINLDVSNIEYQIFVVVFRRQMQLKKRKQMFKI